MESGAIVEGRLPSARTLKRNNAITAIACGALPGLALALHIVPAARPWLAGLSIGLIWANAFEYFYHRYLLHRTRGTFGKGHIMHHITTGKPDEVEHLTFGESPVWVAILFFTNGTPVILAGLLWRMGIAPGILMGFTAYFLGVEEIHWRIHQGGWLPPGFGAARAYHLDHHDIPEGRFNVFLPLFDLLLGTFTSSGALSSTRPQRARWRTVGELALVYTWMIVIVIVARFFSGPAAKG